MILPQSEPLFKYQRYPLTWTLLLLNVLIYFVFFAGHPDLFYNQKILQSDSTVVTGRLYYQFLQGLSKKDQATRAFWTLELSPQSQNQMEILGTYALRDSEFLAQSDSMQFTGDAVAIEKWRVNVAEFKKYYDEDIIYNFGLSLNDLKSFRWITYQFSHAGPMHLFSNMLFLVVVGTAVEAVAGSLALLFLYILGGVVGGAMFLYFNGHGVIPMVGASASVSALLSFYCVIEVRRRIRYVYFISPFPGHNGFIYLPTLLMFPLFMLVDFTNMISNPDGLGSGVAYAAHVGGTLFGLLAGAVARWGLQVKRPLEDDEFVAAESETLSEL